MSGFATDTTIETVVVALGDGRFVHVELERDGVNEDPTISVKMEDGNEVVFLDDHTYSRKVLIDGIEDEDE